MTLSSSNPAEADASPMVKYGLDVDLIPVVWEIVLSLW